MARIKNTARGYRNRENFKTAILFHCGGSGSIRWLLGQAESHWKPGRASPPLAKAKTPDHSRGAVVSHCKQNSIPGDLVSAGWAGRCRGTRRRIQHERTKHA